MLVVAWVSAPLFTLPQTFNYHLTHPYAPLRPEFAQCRNNAYPYEKMVKQQNYGGVPHAKLYF